MARLHLRRTLVLLLICASPIQGFGASAFSGDHPSHGDCFVQGIEETLVRENSTLSEREVQSILNTRLVERFPELSFIYKSPQDFYEKMSERFQKQKEITPEDPYRFDYSDVGLPLLARMNEHLDSRIHELNDLLEKSKQNVGHRLRYPPRELATALEYLNALRAEASGYLKDGKVDYRSMIQFSVYFNRAIGHFSRRQIKGFNRPFLSVDNAINGYRQLSIDREYQMYKDRDFSILQMSLPKILVDAETAGRLFSESTFDPNRLQTVIVSTDSELNDDSLMRLLSRRITLMGVTHDPIQADGFVRPGGAFGNHDLRHESNKVFEWKKYFDAHPMNEEKQARFRDLTDRWYYELDQEILKVRDTNLREALVLLSFNNYHDRGFVMAPSTYLQRKPDPIIYLLYSAEKAGGQKLTFTRPFQTIPRARAWLKEFWAKRAPEESSFLEGK